MHLIVGLGNPGPKYAGNRHNVGFMILERLAERWDAGPFRDKLKGRMVKADRRGESVVLLAPMTFMNLSGESVRRAMDFFKIPLEGILVAHDELDLPFGEIRLKVGGGTAGHNGLKSIVQHAGGNGFARLRFGIGRPRFGQPHDHVLADFSSAERAELPDRLIAAAEAVELALERGVREAMNEVNRRA